MTLDQFKASLETAAGATLINMTGKDNGILFLLSDKRQILAKRQRIKDAADQNELDAYVQGLLT